MRRVAGTILLAGLAFLFAGCGEPSKPVISAAAIAPAASLAATADAVRLSLELRAVTGERDALRQTVVTLTARLAAGERVRTASLQLGGTTARRSVGGGCGGWEALVAAEGRRWSVGLMCRVIRCESTFHTRARNGSHNGLFQIDGGPFDPAANVRLAYSMWTRRGMNPWNASRSCWA